MMIGQAAGTGDPDDTADGDLAAADRYAIASTGSSTAITDDLHIMTIKKSLGASPDVEEEEEQRAFIVGTWWFSISVNLLTMANTLQMGVEADHPDWTNFHTVCENVFTAGFFLEMIIKLAILRWAYFKDKANWLDGSLALLGVLDCWIFAALGGDTDLQSLSILRILRLARLARIVKLVRSFKPFVLVIQGVMQAVATTVNVFVLLIFIFYVFAIFLTEHVGRPDPDLYPGYTTVMQEIDEQEIMLNYNPYLAFGSMAVSMLTLFNMAIMAEWTEIVRPIAFKQGPIYVVVFLVFAMLVAFGVMNVMIGMIVDSVVAESRQLDEEFHKKEKAQKLETLEEVQKLLRNMDTNHDGHIDIRELTEAMQSSRVLNDLLSGINLPIGWAADELLDMLDNNGDGSLEKSEFTTSFYRLLDSDAFQQICIMQASINQVKQLLREQVDFNKEKWQLIERELCSVKNAVSPTSGSNTHAAADTGIPEKAVSEPCSEPCEQHCNTQFKEHAKAVEITNSELAGLTDGVCDELKQRFEHLSSKPLADTIDHISHKQLTETLDAAYTVMKESFQKELATIQEFRVSRPKYLGALDSCSTKLGAAETESASSSVPLLQSNNVPICKSVPLLDTPTFLLRAGMSLLAGREQNNAQSNSTSNAGHLPSAPRPACLNHLDGADSEGCARTVEDFESVASASQAGDAFLAHKVENNSLQASNFSASIDSVAANLQRHVGAGERTGCEQPAVALARDSTRPAHGDLTDNCVERQVSLQTAQPCPLLEFNFDESTQQLGFSVHWDPNTFPLICGVLDGGAANTCGILRGDRLAECNEICTMGKSREEVLQLLKARPLLLRMVRTVE